MSKVKELFDIKDEREVFIDNWDMSKVRYDNKYYLKYYIKELLPKEHDFEKLQWHSERQMMCRFEMAEKVVDFSKVKRWLDIGCGTGDFFKFILDKYSIEEITALDALPEFLDITKNKCKEYKQISYICDNFITMDERSLGTYDLVTLSGVLQNFDLDKVNLAFNKLASLVSKNGQLWVDTLNFEHHKIKKRRKINVWRYKDSELKELLSKRQFTNIESKPFDQDPEMTNTEDCLLLYVYGKKL